MRGQGISRIVWLLRAANSLLGGNGELFEITLKPKLVDSRKHCAFHNGLTLVTTKNQSLHDKKKKKTFPINQDLKFTLM